MGRRALGVIQVVGSALGPWVAGFAGAPLHAGPLIGDLFIILDTGQFYFYRPVLYYGQNGDETDGI